MNGNPTMPLNLPVAEITTIVYLTDVASYPSDPPSGRIHRRRQR